MNYELLWFGYLIIDRKVIEIDAMADLNEVYGPDCDVVEYAQAILDFGLSADFDQVQALIAEACEQAATKTQPPVDVFVKRKPMYEEELAAPVPTESIVMKARSKSTREPSFANLTDKTVEALQQLMDQTLRWSRTQGASDLHLSSGSRPFIRVNREIRFVGDEVLDEDAARRLNLALLTPEERKIFEATGDLDLAIAFDDDNRFRVNIMQHKDGLAGTYRLVADKAYSLEELGFANHKVLSKFLDHHNGLILITGPVGCGKTTTLAAMIDFLNRKRSDHIITVEDPIEFVHESQKCAVTQRQVGMHTHTFGSALKGALREDPDIIAIGELRDLETIEMAITAAETGHLVIGTLHTQDASNTLNRILDVFPPSQQPQIRAMTAESLRGIVCQRLIPAASGGLTVASEVLVNTLAVSNMIREGKIHLLKQVLETGSAQGMTTMDQAIFELYQNDVITQDVAAAEVRDRSLAKRIRAGEGSSQPADSESDADAGGTAHKKKGWFR